MGVAGRSEKGLKIKVKVNKVSLRVACLDQLRVASVASRSGPVKFAVFFNKLLDQALKDG